MKQSATPEATLLVVDDEPNILDLLATSLRFAGFDVVTASNGNEALRQAAAHQVDLVVLDVMMPDMDGFTVLRRLRAAGSPRAGGLPDRPGRHGGQGQGPDRRRG
jgi:Response regulator containing CheY-like receiver, AAA-type ATPase, and DNA-binding domains